MYGVSSIKRVPNPGHQYSCRDRKETTYLTTSATCKVVSATLSSVGTRPEPLYQAFPKTALEDVPFCQKPLEKIRFLHSQAIRAGLALE